MKKPFSCLLEEEVIAEIKRRTSDSVSQAEVVKRALCGEAQVNDPVEKQLANVDGRLEIVDRMVVHLIQSVDRMVGLMIEAKQRSADGPAAEVDRKESPAGDPGDHTGQEHPVPYPPEYTPGGALDTNKQVDVAVCWYER